MDIFEQPDVGITMPDGCRLSARIWMPVNAHMVPVPAIIEHLPYRKRDGTIHRDELGHPYTAAHGYACIRIDMRGNGESQGVMLDEYTQQELEDACNVIQWVSEQNWCCGQVGMMGISWGGFNALQVAALQPPALKAIITVCSSVDRFNDDIHYKGGCLLTENIGWAANMLSYSSRPPDPELVGEHWMSMWLERLNNMPFLASTWLRHQQRDAYWQHGSVCEDYSAIKAAVLSAGGWHDGYRNTISHLVSNISAPVKGIVGPWIHKYPHYAQPEPAIGFLQESLRWWDHWLKGIDTQVTSDPDYRVWVMDSVKPERWLPERPGRWVGEQHWPSNNISNRLYHVKNASSDIAPDIKAAAANLLSVSSGNCDVTINTCQHCGQHTGEYFPFTFGPELPDDQTGDDQLACCADTLLLTEPLTIIGAPEIELLLSSDKPMGHITVRLCDLRPDGTSALITSGMLNLAHRDSFENPAPMAPGKTYRVRFPLDQIAYQISAGHQLRVAFSTAYWPFIWPSPESVTLSVSSATLSLPVKTVFDNIRVAFYAPESAPAWQAETLREPKATRDVFVDEHTGDTVTAIDNDFGEYLDSEHGLRSGGSMSERWSISANDPLSATGTMKWKQTGGRDEWHWETTATVRLHSDREFFHASAELSVVNNGEVIFENSHTDKIERIFV